MTTTAQPPLADTTLTDAPLTDEDKAKIFGLNAARLFGVVPAAERKAIKADKLTQIRDELRHDPTSPSNTQYGWVWVDDGREPTTPVGA